MSANAVRLSPFRTTLSEGEYATITTRAAAGALSSAGEVLSLLRKPRVKCTVKLAPNLVQIEVEMLEGHAAPAWLVPTLDIAARLLFLRENWDSYGGRPIRAESVQRALNALAEFMREDTAIPSVVPTSEGGVQMEWHLGKVDLEIEFPPDEGAYVIMKDEKGHEWEGPFDDAASRIEPVLPRLTSVRD